MYYVPQILKTMLRKTDFFLWKCDIRILVILLDRCGYTLNVLEDLMDLLPIPLDYYQKYDMADFKYMFYFYLTGYLLLVRIN